MAVWIPGSGGGSGSGDSTIWPGDPGAADWIVGFNDFTSTEQYTSTGSFPIGPFWTDVASTGAGTSVHSNTNYAASFGVRETKCNNTVSAFFRHSTDQFAATFTEGTFRVGVRVRFPALPNASGDDFYWYIGFSEQLNTKTFGTDHALLGIELTKNASNFVVLTKDGTTENVTDTGVAVAIDTWYNLEIECTPTAVSAWIDGTSVLSGSTTNHPRTSQACSVFTEMFSRVGTPADFVYSYRDWAYIAFKPASARGSIDTTSGPWA